MNVHADAASCLREKASGPAFRGRNRLDVMRFVAVIGSRRVQRLFQGGMNYSHDTEMAGGLDVRVNERYRVKDIYKEV